MICVRYHKSSYLYENLPVQTKMAILSRRLILLAVLLCEQFCSCNNIARSISLIDKIAIFVCTGKVSYK